MKISSREIIKEAGPKERKRAGGINFEHVRSNLSAGGEEVPRSAIDLALNDESSLLINNEKLNLIEKLNLNDEKNLNEHEKYMFIVGAAITSGSLGEADGKIKKIKEYFRTNHQLNAGSLNLNLQDLYDLEKIKNIFNEKYKEIEEWAKKVEAESERSKSGGYISNDVVYDFGDGWKVVYIPAVGEIEPYSGIPGTSHDRIMEGNKNGLCLGSDLKYYQDNSQGKVYSVRDEDNSPRVTIRIYGDSLQEAKGKKNNPPDVDGAIHATRWFDTLQNLSYADSLDFRSFPPTKIELAIDQFSRNNNSPYYNKWVSAWYKNGIPELDEDVMIKLEEKDPLLFQSGMGKTHHDLVKPVVQFWCKKYADNPSLINMKIIFGSSAELPEHEVFKTYRKLPEMQLAVKQLSEQGPEWFFKIGLQEFPEYRQFSDFPIKVFASSNSVEFLKNFSDKEWAKNDNLIEHVIDICLRRDLTEAGFVRTFYDKEFAKPYIYDLARQAVDSGELNVTSSEDNIRKQDWFDLDLLRFAYSCLFSRGQFDFTYTIADDKDRYKIAEDPYIKEKIHHVAKRFSKEHPSIIALNGEFFYNLGFKDLVFEAVINYFKVGYFNQNDINEFIEKYNNNGWLNELGFKSINSTASLVKEISLIKLSKTLLLIGLNKEAKKIRELSGTPAWLREWRDTMRHYGFKNFRRNKKWHKGKSHLEEPMDKASAEHDIHMVEQAHMPDEHGRRISNDSLDSFMKEFYGESITIAPREGWRKKMSKEEDE